MTVTARILFAVITAGSAAGLATVAACGDDPASNTASDGAVLSDAAATPPSSEAATPAATLVLTVDRGVADAGPAPILVHLTPREPGGDVVRGAAITVTVGGSAAAAAESGAGSYEATLVPDVTSGELTIAATWTRSGGDVTATRRVLVLPVVGDAWGQPEPVAGLVNSAGYEDGIQVSPDGQWLFVSSYSPVDMLACLQVKTAPGTAAACNTSLGPFAAPERPALYGAARIVSPTQIRNRCDKLCLTLPDGGDVVDFALPPVAAYGFHRQADGSFAEPFVFGVDADGCAAPFGYAMTAAPSGQRATVVFSAQAPGQPQIGLWTSSLTLGEPNVLASFACVNGAPQASALTARNLPIDPPDASKGNPSYAGGLLFFDDEYTSSPPRLLVAKPSSPDLGDAGFTAANSVPVGSPTDDQRQPFYLPPTLYFTRNFTIATSTLAGDPTQASSWSAPHAELGAELGSARTGAIVVVGEPSVAVLSDGTKELYFVYGVKTATSVDLQAGRVRAR